MHAWYCMKTEDAAEKYTQNALFFSNCVVFNQGGWPCQNIKNKGRVSEPQTINYYWLHGWYSLQPFNCSTHPKL